MPKILTKAFVEKVNEEDGTLEAAVASTPVVDREGEVIEQEGWDLKEFKKNPSLLWMHNIRDDKPPIGKVVKLWIEGKGKRAKLMFKSKFDLQDEFAAGIFRKFKEGFLNAFSVGFLPIEQEGNIYKEQELLEISAVPVPANPDARVTLRNAGLQTMDWKELGEPSMEDNIEQIMLRDQVEEKPYPGEHACRLEDPKQFDRFNRKNCDQKHDGKCIDVIFGIKEGKSKIQSLRYKKEVWTRETAKSHCSGRGGSFTGASTSQEEATTKEFNEIKKEIKYIKARINQLFGEVRVGKKKKKIKVEASDLGALQDALRIVNQATNIALKRLKPDQAANPESKGGDKK